MAKKKSTTKSAPKTDDKKADEAKAAAEKKAAEEAEKLAAEAESLAKDKALRAKLKADTERMKAAAQADLAEREANKKAVAEAAARAARPKPEAALAAAQRVYDLGNMVSPKQNQTMIDWLNGMPALWRDKRAVMVVPTHLLGGISKEARDNILRHATCNMAGVVVVDAPDQLWLDAVLALYDPKAILGDGYGIAGKIVASLA